MELLGLVRSVRFLNKWCIKTVMIFLAFQVNHIDLAPAHAAVMMGFTNGFANLCGIAAPYVAGVIINDGVSTLIL